MTPGTRNARIWPWIVMLACACSLGSARPAAPATAHAAKRPWHATSKRSSAAASRAAAASRVPAASRAAATRTPPAVELVETVPVDLEHFQCGLCGGPVDAALAAYLGKITHPAQKTVGDSRGATRAASQFLCSFSVDGDTENFRRALNDELKLFVSVELQA